MGERLAVRALELDRDLGDYQEDRPVDGTRMMGGTCLVAMGQKARAMAELQAGLEKYPDSEEFEWLERMLTELLTE